MTASGFGVVTVLPVAVVVVVVVMLMACLMCSSWSFDVVEGVLVVVNGAWYHALVNVLEVVAEALVVAALAGVGQVDAAAVHALLDVAGVVLGALGAALDGERALVLVLRALRHEKGGPRRRHRV
jgi:hypothetical protein